MNVCMIPVRMGSQRLARKNYLKINGLAIFEIAIKKALDVNLFDRVVLNTDDPSLEPIANRHGVDFFLREAEFASSDATSELVVLDFFRHYNCERVFWLNTVSPLQTLYDIQNFFYRTLSENASSSVAVTRHQVHAVAEGRPINFHWDEAFAKTQDLSPVFSYNYSMMCWHESEIKSLESGQLFGESTAMIESSLWSSILLKTKADFDLIEKLSTIAPT